MTSSIPAKFSFAKSNRKRKSDQEISSNLTNSALTFANCLKGKPSKKYETDIIYSRRAHHNELERKRRDHIKDHFLSLKDAIPMAEGGKVQSSRASILKRALEYITTMKKRISKSQEDIEKLKIKNEQLEAQAKLLEQSELPMPNDVKKLPDNKIPTAVTPLPSGSSFTADSFRSVPTNNANLLPNLNTPPTSLTTTTTTTVTNVFPLACSSTNSGYPQIAMFTPAPYCSLLPLSCQNCDPLLQLYGQSVQPILSNTNLCEASQR
uniref:BHLH domain-containing protein n=1 Tax=Syphacia muris TaxID=451379 RepID=A0A0N5APN9_9BILA